MYVCFSQEPVAQAVAVQRPLGPVYREHGRVPGGIRPDRGLRAELVRFDGPGRRGSAGPAQLRAGVLHAGGGRPTGADGLRRTGLAGVRPEPGLAVRVARRRWFRGQRVRPPVGAGPVGSLLLRHRGTPLVRHGRTTTGKSSA